MDDRSRMQVLELNLERQLKWIAAAEGRVAFVFTVDTAMLGLLATLAPSDPSAWTTASAIWATAAATLGLASLLMLAFATFPRTDGPKGSVLYCGGIAKRERKQYEDEMCKLDEKSYIEDLARQCHINAVIADTKFTWLKRALIGLYLAVGPWLVALYLIYGARGAS